jgi:hypothetical protein
VIEMSDSEKLSSEVIARIEGLVHEAESLRDPAARSLTVDLVRAVMELHREALRRIVEIVSSNDHPASLHDLIADDLVSSVLALHEVHPDDVSVRVGRAMDKLSRYFDSRGAGIELLDLDSDIVRLRYTGRAPTAAAKQMIEDVINEAAPEITSIVIDGIEEKPEAGFVPLSVLTAAPR